MAQVFQGRMKSVFFVADLAWFLANFFGVWIGWLDFVVKISTHYLEDGPHT